MLLRNKGKSCSLIFELATYLHLKKEFTVFHYSLEICSCPEQHLISSHLKSKCSPHHPPSLTFPLPHLSPPSPSPSLTFPSLTFPLPHYPLSVLSLSLPSLITFAPFLPSVPSKGFRGWTILMLVAPTGTVTTATCPEDQRTIVDTTQAHQLHTSRVMHTLQLQH